jgi:hypothetical protein
MQSRVHILFKLEPSLGSAVDDEVRVSRLGSQQSRLGSAEHKPTRSRGFQSRVGQRGSCRCRLRRREVSTLNKTVTYRTFLSNVVASNTATSELVLVFIGPLIVFIKSQKR